MAKINVSGTIDKFFPSGKGFSVLEKNINQATGKEYKSWFNVFTTETDGLEVGDHVWVEGFASAGAYMGKDAQGNPEPRGSIGVNQPKVTKPTEFAKATKEEDIF